MTENEKLIVAMEEHKKRHPETEAETLIALGRQLYPKEEQQRGSHAIHEEERERREAESAEMAKVRAIIAQTQQEPYKSREDIANARIENSTGILAEIREKRGMLVTPMSPRKTLIDSIKGSLALKSMAEIAEEKESKKEE